MEASRRTSEPQGDESKREPAWGRLGARLRLRDSGRVAPGQMHARSGGFLEWDSGIQERGSVDLVVSGDLWIWSFLGICGSGRFWTLWEERDCAGGLEGLLLGECCCCSGTLGRSPRLPSARLRAKRSPSEEAAGSHPSPRSRGGGLHPEGGPAAPGQCPHSSRACGRARRRLRTGCGWWPARS